MIMGVEKGVKLGKKHREDGDHYENLGGAGSDPTVLPDRALSRTEPGDHPLSKLKWVDPEELYANDYNPNRVFGPEMDLLKMSILTDGWTQPIVARPDGRIVDGFHRWTTARRNPEIRQMTGGLVPVVFLDDEATESELVASTVRHNRARGSHSILRMGEIVRSLKAMGKSDKEIQIELGMEQEEIDRLSDFSSSPDNAGRDTFGRGWVPTHGDAKNDLDKDGH